MSLLRQPLIRLLAVNLAAGIAVTALMLGGLMALNPGNLRDLIFADRDGAAALVLLGVGLLITLASAAMGGAIMTLNHHEPAPGGGQRGKRVDPRMPVKLHAKVYVKAHAKTPARR